MSLGTDSISSALPFRESQSSRTYSTNAVDDFERYRLTAEIRNDSTIQLVRDSVTGIDTWQSWKRKKHLGRGAFGEVWQEAWEDNEGDWHYRAVKVCSERKMQASQIDYKRELSALVAFSRSECAGWFINLHGWWQASGKVFVAMEYLARGDLSRYASAGVSEPEIKEITENILQGLQFMHRAGFTHRDIKPQNILVFQKRPEFQRWWVKIADFGISKQVLTSSETALHSTVGTRSYCAPEVLGHIEHYRETSVYTNKVDIWSLGCVVFNLGTWGQLAFSESDLVRYCDGNIDFNAKDLPLHLSKTGVSFIKDLLQPLPDQRPTATEALTHRWLTSDNATASRSSGPEPTIRSMQAGNQRNFNSFLDSSLSMAEQHLSSHMPQKADPPVRNEITPATQGHAFANGDVSTDSHKHSDRALNKSSIAESLLLDNTNSKDQRVSIPKTTVDGGTIHTMDSDRVMFPRPEPLASVTRSSTEADKTHVQNRSEDDVLLNAWLAEYEKDCDNSNLETSMHIAAGQGNLAVLVMLKRRDLDVNAKDEDGSTPLHVAAQGGFLEVVQWLVKERADINIKTNSGGTPLHSAAYGGSLEVVQWLVKEGADINIKASNGITPLHSAAQGGSLAVVQWLVKEGADINIKASNGVTPLHCAAYYGYLEVVQWLVKEEVDINVKSSDGSTPLHSAAYRGSLAVVQWLVKEGVDINVKTSNGFTPLHFAAQGGSLAVVRWLVKEGVDINIKSNGGFTPLHFAAQGGFLEVVQWLAKEGANVSLRDSRKESARQVADGKGFAEVAAWLSEQEAIQKTKKTRAEHFRIVQERKRTESKFSKFMANIRSK